MKMLIELLFVTNPTVPFRTIGSSRSTILKKLLIDFFWAAAYAYTFDYGILLEPVCNGARVRPAVMETIAKEDDLVGPPMRSYDR